MIAAVTWEFTDHDDLPAKMCEAIEEQALPLLRPIKTIDDFVGFATKERFRDTYLDLYEHRKIFVDIARGDLDSARSICEYMATDHAKRLYLPLKMDEEYNRITKELCPLIVKRDRAGLARLLHKYEEGSVRAMKLEKYWEPTPFPIELQFLSARVASISAHGRIGWATVTERRGAIESLATGGRSKQIRIEPLMKSWRMRS